MDMMQPPSQPQTVDPATPLTGTLQATEWNTVMEALAAGPYRTVAPIIAKLDGQLRREVMDRSFHSNLQQQDDAA